MGKFPASCSVVQQLGCFLLPNWENKIKTCHHHQPPYCWDCLLHQQWLGIEYCSVWVVWAQSRYRLHHQSNQSSSISLISTYLSNNSQDATSHISAVSSFCLFARQQMLPKWCYPQSHQIYQMVITECVISIYLAIVREKYVGICQKDTYQWLILWITSHKSCIGFLLLASQNDWQLNSQACNNTSVNHLDKHFKHIVTGMVIIWNCHSHI